MRMPIFCFRNYKTDKTLEILFNEAIKGEIKSIKSNCGSFETNIINPYYNEIAFYNGSIIRYWKTNKWYASFARGEITTFIGEQKITHKWEKNMPSRKLINKLLEKIDNFIINDI